MPPRTLRRLIGAVAVDTRPLAHADFRRLFLGQAVAYIGFQLTAVAVPYQMYAISRSSLWVGLIGLAGLIPLVAFGLWGGAIADAVDRRKLYLWSSSLLWTVTLALLVQALLHAQSRWLLLALVAVQSMAFAVSAPVRSAMLPRLLPTSLVPAGNTLNFSVSNVGTIIGPLLAGVVIAKAGYAAAYAIDAVLFTVGFWAALMLPPLPPLGEITRPGLKSVVDGLAYIATRPILMMSFAVDLCAMILAMPRALFPQVAVQEFGGATAAGWLYASIALGALVGGAVSGWIGRVRRQGAALIVSVLIWGAAVAAAGLAGRLWLAVLLLAVGGAADLVSGVYRQTILQTTTPDAMRGRLQGVFTVVVAGGPRLGDLRAGGVAAAVGVRASWVGGGVACVVAVLALAAAVPALMRYTVAPATGSAE